MIKRTVILFVFISLSLGIAFAQGEKGGKVKRVRVTKEVVGEVTAYSRRSISILFQRDEAAGDENEIMIPLNLKKVKFNHIKDLSQLAIGDIVNVQFEEESVVGKDEITYEARVISFVKKGKPKVAAKPQASQVEPDNAGQGLKVLDSNQ